MVTGPRPLSVWLQSYPFRLLIGVLFAALVLYVEVYGYNNEFSTSLSLSTLSFHSFSFVILVIGSLLLHQLAMNLMFVSQMAFFARVSDPVIGYVSFLFLKKCI